MTDKQKEALWAAVDAYVAACGVSVPVRPSRKRLAAREGVESVVEGIEYEARQSKPHPDYVPGSGFVPGPNTDPWDL